MRARLKPSAALIVAAAASALFAIACKKNIELGAFDSGAPSAPSATVAAADVDAATSTVDDAAAPLASLAPPSAPAPAPASTAHAAKRNLPECVEARRFCNHPAVRTDVAIQNLCTKNKQSCFAKGGTL